MKLQKKIITSVVLGLSLVSGIAYATSGTLQERKLVPFPVDDFQIKAKDKDTPSVVNQSEEKSAEQQMIHNANREALMQNWERQVFMEDFGFVGKYQHKSINKALVLFYRKDSKGMNIEDIMKDYAKKYNAAPASIRMKSDELYSLLIEKKDDNSENAETNKIMLYVYKEKNSVPYTVIYVLGEKTQLEDVTNVVEDFFMLINNPIIEQVHVNEDGSLTPVEDTKETNTKDKQK